MRVCLCVVCVCVCVFVHVVCKCVCVHNIYRLDRKVCVHLVILPSTCITTDRVT